MRIGGLSKGIATLLLLASVLYSNSAAAIKPVYGTHLAINGYDPVAYFVQSTPVRGLPEYEHRWKKATWFFASEENRDLFVQNPKRYSPQYGGYCAYAVSQNRTARIDPHAWKIVDGKLYLNFSHEIQERWQDKMELYVKEADANWPRILEPKSD